MRFGRQSRRSGIARQSRATSTVGDACVYVVNVEPRSDACECFGYGIYLFDFLDAYETPYGMY